MGDLGSLSVVIPTRNCLVQLLQGWPLMREWVGLVGEVIVVDSQSSDGTREFLRTQLVGEHISFLDHPPGLYQSWNAGIRAAKGEFLHLSTAGDTVSVDDLRKLLAAAKESGADVVCAAPQFKDQAGNPVEGPVWPIHDLIERGVTQLSGVALQAVAMAYCQVPLRIKSWLGSSASNLYRGSLFQNREFPTDCGHSGDMMFGLRHARDMSAHFLSQRCGQFLLHESAGSRADLFDAFGREYAEEYERQRGQLIESFRSEGESAFKGVTDQLWEALAFDASATQRFVLAERERTREEVAKKEALRIKLGSRPSAAKVTLGYLEGRLKTGEHGLMQQWALKKVIKALRKERGTLPAEPKPSVLSAEVQGGAVQKATCVITAAEINERHGTGVLLKRIFPDPAGIIHIRSMNLYGGETWGHQRILSPTAPPQLAGSTVKQVLSVPYTESDVQNTLAVCEATGAPLCVWLMDHNLGAREDQIQPRSMQALLERAGLRLGISPEFCDLYQQVFGHKVHFVPPVVQTQIIQQQPVSAGEKTGAMLGNLWSRAWLQMLAGVLDSASIRLTSYGHNSPQWVKHDSLKEQVSIQGFLPEPDLIRALRSHPYAIVPTGTLDGRDDLPDIARFSLPSRTLFLSAVGNLPLVVVGHPDTGVARFVTRHGLGVVVPYDSQALSQAVSWISEPEQQDRFRQKAASLAGLFAHDHLDEWLWTSLSLGRPVDSRWETHAEDSSTS
jgi:CTP:molybdopterin cytidylyltransferase MocA